MVFFFCFFFGFVFLVLGYRPCLQSIISILFQNSRRNIHKWESSEIMRLFFFGFDFFVFFGFVFWFWAIVLDCSVLLWFRERNKTAKTQRTVFGHKKTPKRVGTWGGAYHIYIYIPRAS